MQNNFNTENETAVKSTENVAVNTPPIKKKDPEKLFPIRLSKFNTFYLLVVLAAVIALGVGIFVAVTNDLLWGSIIFFAAIAIYVYFTSSELHDKLGIWYKTDAGKLFVTKCRAKYGDVFYIPRRLLWYDVEEICDGAFFSPAGRNSALHSVFLPKTVKKIGKNVFDSCTSLCKICFEGTEEEWNAIENETSLEAIEVIFGAVYPDKK